jgi:hypothetical protein
MCGCCGERDKLQAYQKGLFWRQLLLHTTPSIRIVHIAKQAAPSTTYHRARVTSLLTLALLIRGKVIVLTVVLIKFLG